MSHVLIKNDLVTDHFKGENRHVGHLAGEEAGGTRVCHAGQRAEIGKLRPDSREAGRSSWSLCTPLLLPLPGEWLGQGLMERALGLVLSIGRTAALLLGCLSRCCCLVSVAIIEAWRGWKII